MGEPLAIGVDIGGTKIAFALANPRGDVLASRVLPTGADEPPDAVFDRVAEGIAALRQQGGEAVVGIGIGCPGHLNPTTGVIYFAANLGWRDVPLLDEVKRRLDNGIPVWLQKDANAAALGELYYGAARGQRHFVHLTVGTGLGGAALVNGELVVGAHFDGMEVGHIPWKAAGRLCRCGMRGCPEIYLAGVGLLAAVEEYRASYPESPLRDAGTVTTAAILDAARDGDELATRVLGEAVDALAAVVLACIGMFDPGMITIGGGLALAAPEWYVTRLRRDVERRRAPLRRTPLPIVASQVTSSALGAASLVWHHAGDHLTIDD